MEIGKALAMFSGDRHRIAQAQFIGLEQTGIASLSFRLVCNDDQRHFLRPQPVREISVLRRQSGARVDDE